jgi:SPP1 gp7 family putative phage head morphogenesis protein
LVGLIRHLRSEATAATGAFGGDLMQFAHLVRQVLGTSPATAALEARAIEELRARVLVPLSTHNRRQVDAQLSVRVAPWLTIVPDDALTRSLITAAVRENVGLISRMRERTLQDIETHVQRYAQGGLRHESLAALLEERFGVAESRAKLIGCDQVLKSNSALTQHRQMAAGITHFTWRTSRDEAVRPEHRALEGQIFSWSNPPPIGPPGWDYQCRCTAEPVIDVDGGGF